MVDSGTDLRVRDIHEWFRSSVAPSESVSNISLRSYIFQNTYNITAIVQISLIKFWTNHSTMLPIVIPSEI